MRINAPLTALRRARGLAFCDVLSKVGEIEDDEALFIRFNDVCCLASTAFSSQSRGPLAGRSLRKSRWQGCEERAKPLPCLISFSILDLHLVCHNLLDESTSEDSNLYCFSFLCLDDMT